MAQVRAWRTAGGAVETLILARVKTTEPGNSTSSGISPRSAPRPGEGVLWAPHARGRRGMVTRRPRREPWAPWVPRLESAPCAIPPPAWGHSDLYRATRKSSRGELDFR